MPRRNVPVDPSIPDRIRARRQLRRWSIRHAADRAGISHTTWSRIERGLLRTDRYMISDIAAALDCAVTDLTGQPHTPADRALETAHARVQGVWRTLIEIAPDEPADRPAPPVTVLATSVELLSARRHASDYAAVTQLLPGLLGDLHAAAAGDDARPALRMLVDATHTAMLTLRHLGYGPESAIAAERCRQTAERLGEPVPLAVADWVRAHSAFAAGSHRRAATLTARASIELDRHLDQPTALEVLGMLHLTAASAALGEQGPDAARDHLDEAAKLAARTGESDAWSMRFGPSNAAVWRLGIEVDAGEPGRAVEAAKSVSSERLSTARRASFHVDVARALADLGRAADAVKQLAVAERTAPQLVRSSPAARETGRFLLNRAGRESGLRGLCERLRVVD